MRGTHKEVGKWNGSKNVRSIYGVFYIEICNFWHNFLSAGNGDRAWETNTWYVNNKHWKEATKVRS